MGINRVRGGRRRLLGWHISPSVTVWREQQCLPHGGSLSTDAGWVWLPGTQCPFLLVSAVSCAGVSVARAPGLLDVALPRQPGQGLAPTFEARWGLGQACNCSPPRLHSPPQLPAAWGGGGGEGANNCQGLPSRLHLLAGLLRDECRHQRPR